LTPISGLVLQMWNRTNPPDYICTGNLLPVGLGQGESCSCSLSMIVVFLFPESLWMSGYLVLHVIWVIDRLALGGPSVVEVPTGDWWLACPQQVLVTILATRYSKHSSTPKLKSLPSWSSPKHAAKPGN
jgi:hypothetical protein